MPKRASAFGLWPSSPTTKSTGHRLAVEVQATVFIETNETTRTRTNSCTILLSPAATRLGLVVLTLVRVDGGRDERRVGGGLKEVVSICLLAVQIVSQIRHAFSEVTQWAILDGWHGVYLHDSIQDNQKGGVWTSLTLAPSLYHDLRRWRSVCIRSVLSTVD